MVVYSLTPVCRDVCMPRIARGGSMDRYPPLITNAFHMNHSCLVFAAKNLRPEDIKDKDVIDVGSYNHNGNLYDLFQYYGPKKFVGVDFIAGKGVDVVCAAEDVVKTFGKESFDIVLSSELMEHTRNWREVISNLKQACRPGGTILLTTRSKGFLYHGYPHDYWRYELDDIRQIFSDCEICVLEKDSLDPGVFIFVKKPKNFIEKDLSKIALYSMCHGTRVIDIDPAVEKAFLAQCARRDRILNSYRAIQNTFFKLGHRLVVGAK